MPVHQMRLPREVLIGHGVLDRVSNVCVGLGLTSPALVLTGPQTYHIAAKAVIGHLEKAGFETDLLFVERSEGRYVNKARGVIREFGPKVVLGVGGGKVIDVAKLAASLERVPFVSIPTAASHDGISSSRASIKDSESPASIEADAPVSIIADTEVIAQAPHRLTASGCGDIIAKYTAVKDWRLAHNLRGEYYGEYAASLALMSARLVMKNAHLVRKKVGEGYRVLLEALISCGVSMSIAGSSRPCSGSEHLFSHALDMIAPEPALHGEQCGVGAILMAYLQGTRWRMIREKLGVLGAPTTAKELDIAPKYIIKALTQAHRIRPDRYTILGDEGLTRGAAERLARSSGVID
ncbi:MAG: NAD(P)-dependent glycerol-1-phosphate dehydrogenase [Candidatus Bathyarchaeia archaeon]